MTRIVRWLFWSIPLLVSLTVLFFVKKYHISYDMKHFDKVLDSSITFSSIVIGFLGALLGILVSIKDSSIVTAIFETKEKFTLNLYFKETFIIGFLVVILSCLMHVLRSYPSKITDVIYNVWFFLTVWFLPATYRIVSILMAVFFRSNNKDNSSRSEGNRVKEPEKRIDMKSRLKKPDQ